MVFRAAAAFQNDHPAIFEVHCKLNTEEIVYRRYLLCQELPVPIGGGKKVLQFKNQIFLFTAL